MTRPHYNEDALDDLLVQLLDRSRYTGFDIASYAEASVDLTAEDPVFEAKKAIRVLRAIELFLEYVNNCEEASIKVTKSSVLVGKREESVYVEKVVK